MKPNLPHDIPAGTDRTTNPDEMVQASPSYIIAGKNMVLSLLILSAIMLLFFIGYSVVRHCQRRRRRRANLQQPRLFFSNRAEPSPRGLDQNVIDTIPVIELSIHGDDTTESCAVCIGEFTDGEKVRILPQCRHQFHLECIDMWFGSHSTCPLCRADISSAAKSNIVELEETQNKDLNTIHSIEHQSPLDHMV